MKFQEEAEEDEVGNDNLNGLERSDQSPQTEYFPWRGRRLRGMRQLGFIHCLFRKG